MTSQRKLLAALAIMLASGIGTAHAQDCSNEAGLRSASQGAPVELSFRNASSEGRRLYWLDQNGTRKFISVVRPGTIYSQPTAATHSWVVTDEAEKCLFAVTATTEPQTIDVGGQTVGQIAPPSSGSQQPIVAVQAPDASSPPSADPAPIAAAAPEAERSVSDLASDAGGEDIQVEVPQVSPIEQLSLTGSLRVLAVLEEGKSLNNQASGTVEVVRVNPEWDSGQWSFEPVSGSPFVRIKNNWRRTYLADVNGQLKAIAAQAEADQSHWSVEPVDGTSYVQLRNRETDRFLLNVNGAPNLVNDFNQDQERQSYWQVNPATDAVAVTAPRIAALSAYNSAITDCRDIGGVWTGSSCRSNYAVMGYGVAQPLACPRGWFWDQQAGECLYEVASGGPACPPWQVGPGGQCVSNLTCRGGTLRSSRRGASCDCPFGMAPWGNYPNLSCKPSVARIVPLLLLSKHGGSLNTKQRGPRFALGQAFGNKQFGRIPLNNTNNGIKVTIKVSKPTNTPNVGTPTRPVITNPVVTNPTRPNPTGVNVGGTNPVGVLTNPTNPVTTTTPTGNTPPDLVKNFNGLDAKTKDTVLSNCQKTPAEPSCNALLTQQGKLTPAQQTSINACRNNPALNGCNEVLKGTGIQAKPNTGNTPPDLVKNFNGLDAKTKDTVLSNCQKTPAEPSCNALLTQQGKLTPAQQTSINACKNNPALNGCNEVLKGTGINTNAATNAQLDKLTAARCRLDPSDVGCKPNTGNTTANPKGAQVNVQAQNDAKAKAEADAKAKADAANKLKIEADNKAKIDAANKAKADAANKLKIEADNKAKIDAANKAKIDAAAKQREANARAKADADAKAKANAAKLRAEGARQAEQARNAAALRQQAQQNARNRPVNNRPAGCPPGRRPLPNGRCG